MIYIAIIQSMLFYLATVVTMCELTHRFSNSFTSIISRFSIAISLLVIAYYTKLLVDAPTPLIFALLFVAIFSSVMVSKHILQEYFKRLRRFNANEKHRHF